MNSTRAPMPADVESGETAIHEGVAQPRRPFFLTLCPVAAPIAVRAPTLPRLQGLRFFLTRRHEDGHERCWLHFGHFRTVGEAQKWLNALRKVYPRAVMRTVSETQETAHQVTDASESRRPVVAQPKSLNDTQVLSLLQKQRLDRQHLSPQAARPTPESGSDSTLEDTLNELRGTAQHSALEMDDDSLSSTGVRHLRVEVQGSLRTSREQKGGGTPPVRKS